MFLNAKMLSSRSVGILALTLTVIISILSSAFFISVLPVGMPAFIPVGMLTLGLGAASVGAGLGHGPGSHNGVATFSWRVRCTLGYWL